jgi:hypothetical protein
MYTSIRLQYAQDKICSATRSPGCRPLATLLSCRNLCIQVRASLHLGFQGFLPSNLEPQPRTPPDETRRATAIHSLCRVMVHLRQESKVLPMVGKSKLAHPQRTSQNGPRNHDLQRLACRVSVGSANVKINCFASLSVPFADCRDTIYYR